MNLRAKIARLEASVPKPPLRDPCRIGRLLRRIGQLVTREEMLALAGRAQAGETTFPVSGSPKMEDEIAALEARWLGTGRALPEYAWVDRDAWGAR